MSTIHPLGLPRWDEKRKSWVLQARKDGRRRSFYSSNPSARKGPAECRAKAQSWLDQYDAPDRVRFGDAWDRFMDYYSRKFKVTSAGQINSRCKAHLLPVFRHRVVSEIRKREWQAVIDNAFENGANSAKTLKGIATTITTFCKWAAAHGYLSDAAVPVYFDIPIGATIKQKRILQPDQLRILFSDDSDEWYLPMFRFLAVTGLRRGELCALQQDRDFDGQRITIQESISHEQHVTDGKTTQSNRSILLGALALEQLAHHRLMRAERSLTSRYLFCCPKGYRINPRAIRNHWQRWREANGIDLTLHELRHTFISYSRLKTEESLDDLKQLYGHSKQMNTDGTYVHDILLTPSEIARKKQADQRIAGKIDDVFRAVIVKK